MTQQLRFPLYRLSLYCVALALAIFIASTSVAVDVPLNSSWLLNAGSSATGGNTAQLSSNSASGYTYLGQGTTGNFPDASAPDSRTYPKVYNEFSTVDLSAIGSTLSMTYDILWLTESPSNESQDWRFGFVSSNANGGLGTTVGANFDIGNLTGTTYYEFAVDPEINPTSTDSGVPADDMDFAFTATNNSQSISGVATDYARIAQSQNDPFNTGANVDGDYNDDQSVDAADYTVWRDNLGTATTLPNDTTPGSVDSVDYDIWRDNYGAFDTEDIVAFNDITDTHRVSFSLTRVANGYDMQFDWTNLDRLVNGVNPTITHTTTILTTDLSTSSDPFGSATIAAGVTEWDRLGFFINAVDNRVTGGDLPWEYVLSNVSVDTTGVISSASSAVSVPEPATACLLVFSLCGLGICRR